jgi:SIR2-like domain
MKSSLQLRTIIHLLSVCLINFSAMKRFRILILGAGFSYPAGLPLGTELFTEVRTRAQKKYGRDNILARDMAEFIEYKKRCEGVTLSPDGVNFEDFLSYLDVEHYLWLRGSDTWSDEGNPTQLMIKRLIGQIIHERTPHVSPKLPNAYLKFADQLGTTDKVITFNYDILLERCLDHMGKPYRLFPHRFSSIGLGINTVDTTKDEVVILKMHGSVDWFDRSSYEIQEQMHKKMGLPPPHHTVFEDPSIYVPRPIVDGPRNVDDPLLRMYRIERVDDYYAKDHRKTTPWLLSPSTSKILYARTLKDFWDGLGQAGVWNLGVGVIGYSMPVHDEYVRQFIYNLVRNYFEVNEDLEFNGARKVKLKMVDYRPTPESKADYKNRFQFVDWNKTDLFLNGFGEDAIPVIFDSSI